MTELLRRGFWLASVAIMFGVLASPAPADFLLSTTSGFGRYESNGNRQFLDTFLGETLEGMTVGPDGYVYMVTNDLGQPSIYRFDPVTNEYVDGVDEYGYVTPWAQYGLNQPFPIPYLIPGRFKFGPYGDLFAIGSLFSSPPPAHRILRIDGETSAIEYALDGALEFVFGPRFVDIGVSDGGDLFVAISDGTIQRHTINEGSSSLATTFDTGIDNLRSMAIGPDGLLYLSDGVTDSIFRYDPDSMAMDIFVRSLPVGDANAMGDFYFGPGGDLFVIIAGRWDTMDDSHLLRFDGDTGAYLGIAFSVPPITYVGFSEPGFARLGLFVPVPEPTSLPLLVAPAVAMLVVRRRR